MQLKLIAVYLDNSQLEYILSINNSFLQENFNFNFEYYDSESNFATLHNIRSYPSFYLTKNDLVAAIIEGKTDFLTLKERLLKLNYVTNSNS